MEQDRLASLRQPSARALSFEYREAELVLKARNPPTDRRCIDSEKRRRSSEISGIRHSDEILQLQQLH
jgi:hypothetical protein